MEAIQSTIPLTSLRVSECFLGDFHVQHFAAHCPDLQNVQLRQTGYLSDSSVMALAHNCPGLQTLEITLPLNIVQSNTITMESLEALGDHCPRLSKLICPGQTRIAGPQARAFVEHQWPLMRDYDLSLPF
ncbi:hypothetical protein CLU79DRAFT_706279 [Phycomyces nitens]|nr:hypothetical protein CLU79DRAFT_706279 [Phycomyces nitens]